MMFPSRSHSRRPAPADPPVAAPDPRRNTPTPTDRQWRDHVGAGIDRAAQQVRHLTSQLTPRQVRQVSTRLYTASLRLPGARRYWWAYALFLLGLMLFTMRLTALAAEAWDDSTSRWQYGPLRTTQLAVVFGAKEEPSGTVSRLTAVNDAGLGHVYVLLGGQVSAADSILEVPGGDTAGRLPLLLAARDADRDGHPDLIVRWGTDGPPLVYLFDTGKAILRPPTAEEATRLYGLEDAP